MEVVREKDKVLIYRKQDPEKSELERSSNLLVQTIVPVKTLDHCHFGRIVLLSLPYLFISEPGRNTGVISIYRWCTKQGLVAKTSETRGCQFRLFCQVHSEQKLHGFCKALAYEEPFLFVSDCTNANYRGSVYVVKVTERAPQLRLLYTHTEADECVGLGLEVQHQQSWYQIQVRGVHRASLAGFVIHLKAKPNLTLRHHPLEVVAAPTKESDSLSQLPEEPLAEA